MVQVSGQAGIEAADSMLAHARMHTLVPSVSVLPLGRKGARIEGGARLKKASEEFQSTQKQLWLQL